MFFHSKETPNLNTIFFKKKNNKLRKIPKTLIISGGSRNGNHLIWSLLDGNDDIPYLPGEDKFLSQIFWRNLRSSKIFENNLMKKKSSFLRKMSGLRSDKWIRFYKKNINNVDIKILKKKKIDFFIHLAAVSSVEKANLDQIKTYESNIRGLMSAVELAEKLKCKSFLFASSAAVYGNTKKLPIFENHPLNSEGFY